MKIKPRLVFMATKLFDEKISNVSRDEIYKILSCFCAASKEVIDINCPLEDQGYIEDHPIESVKLKTIVEYLGLDENNECLVCWDI